MVRSVPSALPPIGQIQVRPNVRRIASLSRSRSRPPGKDATLHLSSAVVEAGPEAWRLLAPALEGERGSLRRLRVLTNPGMERNRRRRARGGGGPRNPRPSPAPALPETPCDGTPEERRFLLCIITLALNTSSVAEAASRNLQLRISRRMTSRLGSFRWIGDSRRITIAQRLFRPGLEDILRDTVLHELAHLADHVTSPNGRTSHGPGWRAWAERLGARPERRCSPEDAARITKAAARTAGSSGQDVLVP